MKNFLSQTWVVALLVVITLAVVCYIAFKKKKDFTIVYEYLTKHIG